MQSINVNARRGLIVLVVFVISFSLFWIRYGAMFGKEGVFDREYHRQAIINVDSPSGYGDSWTSKEPYICRIMKDADSNPENPFSHCSLGTYIGQWLLFPSTMKSDKANR